MPLLASGSFHLHVCKRHLAVQDFGTSFVCCKRKISGSSEHGGNVLQGVNGTPRVFVNKYVPNAKQTIQSGGHRFSVRDDGHRSLAFYFHLPSVNGFRYSGHKMFLDQRFKSTCNLPAGVQRQRMTDDISQRNRSALDLTDQIVIEFHILRECDRPFNVWFSEIHERGDPSAREHLNERHRADREERRCWRILWREIVPTFGQRPKFIVQPGRMLLPSTLDLQDLRCSVSICHLTTIVS